jgi:hypothetical protein
MSEEDCQRMIDMIKCICEDVEYSATDRLHGINEVIESWS